MTSFRIRGSGRPVKGSIALPGDKSICHRSLILAALSRGRTVISNFPANDDCLATISILKKLGCSIRRSGDSVTVTGKGLYGLRPSRVPLFINESGTTFRLLMGVLAGQDFSTTITAGTGLARRPMARVSVPLRMMGADITGRIGAGKDGKKEEYPPVVIRGRQLKAITFSMSVASAQVKSAILLAGLYAKGTTRVREKFTTRDHTERMLRLFGVKTSGAAVRGGNELVSPGKFTVPGDISSAAFFMVLAAVIPGSEITIRNVSLNRTRAGVIAVLRRMGADITVFRRVNAAEPSGDVRVRARRLTSTLISRAEVPFLIDEIPVLMVAAACAQGKTVFGSVGELRVKETDRIGSMVANLRAMGVACSVSKKGQDETMAIQGPAELTGGHVKSFGDHRTAMSMAIAGLAAKGETVIDDVGCVAKSFPGFINCLKKLVA